MQLKAPVEMLLFYLKACRSSRTLFMVLEVYQFTQTVTVGYGQALANPQFGTGGLDQFYVPNVQKLIDKGILVLVGKIDLVK